MAGNILVTGGCGYIGSHVTRLLTEAGRKAVVIDNLSTGSKEALLYGEAFIQGDLADENLIREVLNQYEIESVLHFAASVVVPESVANPLMYYENNTSNVIKLLRACTQSSVQNFILSSTAAVYGETMEPYVSEDVPLNPASPYGRSKLMDEWILTDAAKAHGFNYAILRYFNVAGAEPLCRLGQRLPDSTHLIKVACRAALGANEGITIFGTDYPTPDGTCVRDYVHVEDLAQAHILSLNHLESGRGSLVLNCGYERGYSVSEVLESVKRISGADFQVHSGPRRPGDIPALIARTKLIKEVLNWVPKYKHLDDIVRTALAWERQFHSNI